MTITEIDLIHVQEADFEEIQVQEADFEEIQAKHVDFFLTIKGMSLIMGDAALNKAREVQQLVTELKAIGVTDADIKLLGVQADVSTGILGRNSSAVYSLQVHCEHLEAMPDFLGVITAQKNITVNYLQWSYGDLREVQGRLLDHCIERANAKAKRVAQGLKVTIAGVHYYDDQKLIREGDRNTVEEAMQEMTTMQSMAVGQRRLTQQTAVRDRNSGYRDQAGSVSLSRQDLALLISHTRLVVVGVTIDYRMAPLEESA